MSGPERLAGLAAAERLEILGHVPVSPADGLAQAEGTLALLGPAEPGYWAHLAAQPEWRDGAPDPVDRWSRRVITRIAGEIGATAVFPFGGPPWHPFFTWALRSGRTWQSPVRLLVHDRQGLMVSFRGAVLLAGAPAPAAETSRTPCQTCADRPCLAACPAGALSGAGYDVPACHAYLDSPAGKSCLDEGCAVRRACPVSQAYGRLAMQSSYHMRQFHP